MAVPRIYKSVFIFADWVTDSLYLREVWKATAYIATWPLLLRLLLGLLAGIAAYFARWKMFSRMNVVRAKQRVTGGRKIAEIQAEDGAAEVAAAAAGDRGHCGRGWDGPSCHPVHRGVPATCR